jgi:hypothetical protein
MGTKGTTIPKPTRSMKTVKKMTKTEGFLMRRACQPTSNTY